MQKSGYKTTEFYITAAVNIIAALLGLLATRGLVSSEEVGLYQTLANAVIAAVAPVVMAFVSGRYISGRSQVKAANGSNGDK